jgi:FKBP-type peptidyl-prolyl cis-trans isomerase
MIKKALPFVIAAAIIGFSSCKSNGDFKTKDGFLYKIVNDVKGKNAVMGDILRMNIVIKNVTLDKSGNVTHDTVLIESRKVNNNEPVEMQLQPSGMKGDWLSCLPLLSAGDSAVLRISVDTLKKSLPPGQPLPPFMKPGSYLQYEISLVSVKSKEDYKKEMEQKSAEQAVTDEKMLQEYFTKNNLHPSKTASGLYYIMQKEGTGNSPLKDQEVTVNYTGKTIEGVTFDSNLDTAFHHTQPFTFAAGDGQTIKGWDEGVMMMKKGGKATFFIPSGMAYGPKSPSPKIAPNSNLVFDIEVLDIKNVPVKK